MLLKQSLYIVAGILVVLFWQTFNLSSLTIPAIGILVLGYLIFSRKAKKPSGLDNLTISILTALIFILIFTTGDLNSPLYFLLYFILFGITFVMLPETIFVFLVGAIILFLPHLSPSTLTQDVIKIASLILISPLAFFFGKEYRVVQIHEQKDQAIAEKIISEAGTVLKNEETTLTQQDKTELAEIIQESEELKG